MVVCSAAGARHGRGREVCQQAGGGCAASADRRQGEGPRSAAQRGGRCRQCQRRAVVQLPVRAALSGHHRRQRDAPQSLVREPGQASFPWRRAAPPRLLHIGTGDIPDRARLCAAALRDAGRQSRRLPRRASGANRRRGHQDPPAPPASEQHLRAVSCRAARGPHRTERRHVATNRAGQPGDRAACVARSPSDPVPALPPRSGDLVAAHRGRCGPRAAVGRCGPRSRAARRPPSAGATSSASA